MNQHLSSDTETNSKPLYCTPVRIARKVAYFHLVLGFALAAITVFLLIIGVIRIENSLNDLIDITFGTISLFLISLLFYLIVELFKVFSQILSMLMDIKAALKEGRDTQVAEEK